MPQIEPMYTHVCNATILIHLVHPHTYSLRLMEAFVRAAASCQENGLAWAYLQKLLDDVDRLPSGDGMMMNGGGRRKNWAPKWDTFSIVMKSCRKARDIDGLLKVFKASLPFSGFSKTVLLNMLLAGR